MVALENVSRRYVINTGAGRRELLALDNVSLDIGIGETLGLVGESGSGKSTLARVLAGLESPTSGRVVWRTDLVGEEVVARARVQMVFQNPARSLNPKMSVGSIVEEPLRQLRMSRADRDQRVSAVISAVGLPTGYIRRHPEHLSGGQQQRVAIARALAPWPALIVLDEALSSLDVSLQASLLDLLRTLKSTTSTTYLFIAHDLHMVEAISDRVAVLYHGSVMEIAREHEIARDAYHPYSMMLHASDPSVALSVGADQLIPESPVDPADSWGATGCKFSPRCPIAVDECSLAAPALTTIAGSDRAVACRMVNSDPWTELTKADRAASGAAKQVGLPQ